MICQGCHKKDLNYNLFFNVKALETPFKQCINCRQQYKTTKQNKRKSKENRDNDYIQIDPREISDHLYDLLTDLSTTNDFYDVSGILFVTKFVINLEWLIGKYLHHFNHSRLDLLIHILIQKVIP